MRAYLQLVRLHLHTDLHEIKIQAHKIVIDHHIKSHENPSFCYGDICKTILTFVKSLVFNVFLKIFLLQIDRVNVMFEGPKFFQIQFILSQFFFVNKILV